MSNDSLLSHRVSGSGPTIVFLHGFTQTGRSWDPITNAFEATYTCITVDLPGHGNSTNGARSLTDAADDVAAVLRTLDAPATVVGYSMGARVALHVALAHPDLLRRLVLVSGTGGIDDAAERAGRRASDGALAVRIEKIGTDAFLAEWLAQPMFRTLPPDAASLDERRRNSPTGLADSLRHSGTGTQEPLWDRLVRLDVPALVVTGDLDTKFTALGERLAEHLPRATHVPVADAGHTVHLEAPATFVDVVRRWLAETA
ncbi:MAG: hypothetical protein RLY50_244 [Actinomycetota bacterium]